MKSFFTGLFLIGSCLLYQNLNAQIDESGNSFYVVIGAFSQEKNAKEFTKWAKQSGLNARYELNQSKKLYYVYTLRENDWGIPVQEAEKIRTNYPKLDDTWVYHGLLETSTTENQLAKTEETESSSSEANSESNENPIPVVAEDNSKQFFFKLYAEDGTSLKSPIEIIDLDNSKLSALYQSNESISLKPVNKSGRIMAQIKLFGYRLKQIGIDFNNPTDSAGISIDSGRYVVPIEMNQLVRGDISIMYNVFFFKDAGIMRPDSKYEVNALVAMMQEFPNRNIVIHGHTNGTARGKILTMGDKKNFFSLTGCVTGSGSATQLSKERAQCIVDYLISNGIDSKRMEVKAWGGKKPIHPTKSERAVDNVRVEVEIAKD